MPACSKRLTMRGERLAGPMVQTIFEWRKTMISREREFTTFRAQMGGSATQLAS
jgi:hypothetical protein